MRFIKKVIFYSRILRDLRNVAIERWKKEMKNKEREGETKTMSYKWNNASNRINDIAHKNYFSFLLLICLFLIFYSSHSLLLPFQNLWMPEIPFALRHTAKQIRRNKKKLMRNKKKKKSFHCCLSCGVKAMLLVCVKDFSNRRHRRCL